LEHETSSRETPTDAEEGNNIELFYLEEDIFRWEDAISADWQLETAVFEALKLSMV